MLINMVGNGILKSFNLVRAFFLFHIRGGTIKTNFIHPTHDFFYDIIEMLGFGVGLEGVFSIPGSGRHNQI